MGKGSNTSSTTSSTSADPQAAALYRDILSRAQGVASSPYQAYTGQLSAPTNAQQNLGVGTANMAAGYANPFLQQAQQQAAASSAPISAGDIQRYQNPYTQQVVDATTAQLMRDFGQQNAQLQGNQIAQGALGGNATGVAKAILAGQQGRTLASTTSGLYQQSYQQALDAAQRQQQAGLAGANAFANYGLGGQNAQLQAAQLQYGLGTQQQSTEQANLDRLYQQYAQAQAFPYQQAQWLAGMATGVGSNLGGTSSGTTTGPSPNSTAQWLGAGLTAASLLSDRHAKTNIEKIGTTNDGQNLYRYQYKGSPDWHIGPMAQEVEPEHRARGVDGMLYIDLKGATDDAVERRASGGGVQAPWAGVGGAGWIPQIGIAAGRGAPEARAPSPPNQQQGADPSKLASGLAGAVKGIGGLDWGGAWNAGLGNLSGDAWGGGSFWGGDTYGGSSATPLAGLDPSDYGDGFADGGAVLGDYDPPGGVAGQQTAAGPPYQMRPSGGQIQVVNTRTGQVVYTGSHSGASSYAASMNARQRASGGGVAGYARGGDPVLEPDIDHSGRDYHDPAWISSYGLRDEPPLPAVATEEPSEPLTFNERAAPVQQALASGAFDPQGINGFDPKGGALDFAGTPGMEEANAGVIPLPQPRPSEPPVVAQGDDGAAVPSGVSGRMGGAGRPPVMAFEDSEHYRRLPDAVSQPERRGFGLGLLPSNVSQGLMAAGLGMMASRSPFLGTAVGEGGLAGLGAYSRAEAADREAALEAQKLAREARKEAYDRWMGERKQGETERHNIATEEKTAADRLPPGMMLDDKGQLVNRPGYLSAMEARTKAKTTGATMDDETAEFLAHRVLAGDTKALVGLGRGAQGAENLAKINGIVARLAKEGTPVNDAARNILQNAAQQQGLIAAERTQANIMAKLSVYGRTAYNATDIAERLSEEVPRTQFMPVNQIINAARKKTGDPKIVALGQALMTLTNEYARAIGGGHGTVHDKEAAEKRLSEAQSHEQLKAVINVMRQEILAEERAMPAARQHIRDIYNPRKGGTEHTIGGEHGRSPSPGVTAVPPISGREVGKVYPTPKGDLRWNGSGWEKP